MVERRRGAGRRATDRSRWVLHVQENWYRDVWLMLITVVVVLVAAKALVVAGDASTAVKDVQQSRVNNCLDQNQRHKNTVVLLNKEISQLPEPLRSQAKANEKFTLGLIGTLSPFNPNCSNIRIHLPK